MIGRAMSIGMAKPIPVESRSTAVLMPMTSPAASSERSAAVAGVDRGVGLDQVREVGRRHRSRRVRPVAEMIPVVTVLVYVPSGRADGDRQLADLDVRGLAHRGRRQPGRVDLDDREVGQRVDAVDGARELAAVLELDRQLRGDRHACVRTTCRLVRIQPPGRRSRRSRRRVSGIVPPSGSVVVPDAVIRTTAGLTLAAALTTADESSMAIGLRVWPAARRRRGRIRRGRFSAPVAVEDEDRATGGEHRRQQGRAEDPPPSPSRAGPRDWK